MPIVLDDAAAVIHGHGCATLFLVLRQMTLVANCGAVVTAVLGCFGLLFPRLVSRVLGIQPDGPLGISEFRATYGGFFLCLGVGCLVAQSVPVFKVVGAAWCAAALTRTLSFAVDGSRRWHGLVGVLVEAVIGLALMAAQLY